MDEILNELKALRKEVVEIKKNQEQTHKNQVDMENKLDQIKNFENIEAEELKELEYDHDVNALKEDFEGVESPFITTVLENLAKKMETDEWLTIQHKKVIEYLFSREKYQPHRKKFTGANFSEIQKGAHVNRSALKDILVKLEESRYIFSEITSEVDKSRRNYTANFNQFKNG